MIENNKKELPFVYNVGDRLKYIYGKGETITVIERHHQYSKETDTTKNIYLLTIEDYEGCGYKYQDLASENYMMTYMHRVYSPGKFLNPEDFEKRSNDTLSCGYYKALEGENEALKRENEELREINEGLAHSYENVKKENETLKAEKERKMMEDSKRESIYKIGDVLSHPDTASTYLILALREVNIAGNACQYKCLKTRKCYCDDAQIVWVSEFFFVKACNRVGHIDISWLTGEPDAKPTSGRYKWGEYESFNDRETKAGSETFNPDDYNLFDGDLAFKTCEEQEKNDICDEYDALEAKIKKLTEERDLLKIEVEATKARIDRQRACYGAWKQGWTECLKTFKYYLGTDEDEE